MAACLGGAFIAKKVTEHRYEKLQPMSDAEAPYELKSELRKTQSDLQMPPVKPGAARRVSKPPSSVPPPPPGNPPHPVV